MSARIVLVTGASRGFGRAVAEALAGPGTHVILLARTVGGLEEAADGIEAAGGSATLVPLSLTDDAGLQRMCLAIHQRWGRLDLVVHAAATAPPLAPVIHIAPKDLDSAIAVNLRATQRLIAMTEPLLRAATAGHFVHVTDDRAHRPLYGAYGATKAAAASLVTAWAGEAARIGPKVTLFQPAPMPTAIRARFFPGERTDTLTPCRVEARRLVALIEGDLPASAPGPGPAASGPAVSGDGAGGA